MSLVDEASVLEYTPVEEVDLAMSVVNYRLQAKTRMREILTRTDVTDTHNPRGTSDITRQHEKGDLYDDIVNLNEGFEQSDKDQLKHAETLYCFAVAMHGLSLRINESGGFVQSTGHQEAQTNYLKEGEITRHASHFKRQSVMLAEDLRPFEQKRTIYVV